MSQSPYSGLADSPLAVGTQLCSQELGAQGRTMARLPAQAQASAAPAQRKDALVRWELLGEAGDLHPFTGSTRWGKHLLGGAPAGGTLCVTLWGNFHGS